MISYAITTTVISVATLKEGKGFRLNTSLGFNKGFATIFWTMGENKFSYFPAAGDKIFIPKCDMVLSSYTHPQNGAQKTSLNIFCNYLEKVVQYEKKEPTTKKVEVGPVINKNIDEQLANVEWNDEDDSLAQTVIPTSDEEKEKGIEEARRDYEELLKARKEKQQGEN